jgi:hypothetical protein
MRLPGPLTASEEKMLTSFTLFSNINILYTKSNTDRYKLQQSRCLENLNQGDKETDIREIVPQSKELRCDTLFSH